jgi:phosphoserine phosphatase
MVVFDFDKTLINKDTLFGFYKIVHGDGLIFKIKHLILLIFAIFYKLKIIDNNKLKKIGIRLFLKGKTKEEIDIAAVNYAKTLKLNRLYDTIFLKTPKEKRIIISASPAVYLKKVFPGEKVLGTLLNYEQNRLKGLKKNCYGKNKVEFLKEIAPDLIIEKVYSDSMSDKPLFEKSEEYYIVKNAKLS